MTMPFSTWDTVTTGQVRDYYENGFRKIVVRIATGKNTPDYITGDDAVKWRETAIDEILNTLSQVYTKAVQDNPDDAMILTSDAVDQLGRALNVLTKICGDKDPEMVTYARPRFYGVQARIALI